MEEQNGFVKNRGSHKEYEQKFKMWIEIQTGNTNQKSSTIRKIIKTENKRDKLLE